ncbi:MAG TPA: metallophosphoesterase [Rhodanobacter sp.]|nr:metallophosphoesterase [Rhodanobacter sp.]
MSTLRRFDRNVRGRDFVVGDIHGCFERLQYELDVIGFNGARDRLFSVGDLVDRGPSSEECVDWIAKPWFHAVRGNHEQMAIGVAAGRHDAGNYLVNGGGWFLALDESRQKLIAEVLDSLPYLIEVDTPAGRVGIVHAEINGDSWAEFSAALDSVESNNKRKRLTEIALWSRTRITHGDTEHIKDLHCLYVGHTPIKHPVELGNVRYIDTGCVFGGRLTVVAINDEIMEMAV